MRASPDLELRSPASLSVVNFRNRPVDRNLNDEGDVEHHVRLVNRLGSEHAKQVAHRAFNVGRARQPSGP